MEIKSNLCQGVHIFIEIFTYIQNISVVEINFDIAVFHERLYRETCKLPDLWPQDKQKSTPISGETFQ
jgi:hypothetical protein